MTKVIVLGLILTPIVFWGSVGLLIYSFLS